MQEKEEKIYHKIEPGNKYRVWKSTFNDRTYYKIQVVQKEYDGTKTQYYVGLQFKKNVELDNQTDIIIHKAYENFRKNPLDKYNPIVYLMVTDFEICERQEQIESQAYADFQQNLYENENQIEISDDFLD